VRQGYGLRPIALRTLERSFNALSLATAALRRGELVPDAPVHLEIAALIARESRAAYRRLVYDEADFYRYFQAVTPIDVIEAMQIGSRSVHRTAAADLAALLPVPWVFAWSQTRCMLPGWYGAGAGLAAARERFGLEQLRAACSGWFFLSNLIADVERLLARADMDIAAYYDALAPAPLRRFTQTIRREYAAACSEVLAVRNTGALLDSEPTLQRSIQLRNPYGDPINLMQVDLLERWRASARSDRALFEALQATVGGIAQGQQSTG
jgi:phosphoenolpyruvate carboxylase